MWVSTTSREAITSNNACLDDSVLLTGKGPTGKSKFELKSGPELDEEETKQTGGDIEGGNDAVRENELVSYDTEDNTQDGADQNAPEGDLIFPIGNEFLVQKIPLALLGFFIHRLQQWLRYLHRSSGVLDSPHVKTLACFQSKFGFEMHH